jgi:hypothetical protein
MNMKNMAIIGAVVVAAAAILLLKQGKTAERRRGAGPAGQALHVSLTWARGSASPAR